jgi:hypothetical protein
VTFDQAIAHAATPASGSRNAILIHRGCDRANLVADWGYSNDDYFDDELGALYQTNSLWIEHRYQGESIPEAVDWDWTALTIKNGATDMHEVITSFRKHYGGRFVTTGESKGGITATYHKYFFPDDVDGSIPYVAPASRERIDPLYQTYLDTTLPSPCAQNVRNAQVAALTSRRPMMLAQLTALAPGFEALYLEYIVGNFDWAFWQYYGVSFCNRGPTTATPDESFWNFFARISGISNRWTATRDDGVIRALYYEWPPGVAAGRRASAVARRRGESTMERIRHPAPAAPAHLCAVTADVWRWSHHADDPLLSRAVRSWSVARWMPRSPSGAILRPRATWRGRRSSPRTDRRLEHARVCPATSRCSAGVARPPRSARSRSPHCASRRCNCA